MVFLEKGCFCCRVGSEIGLIRVLSVNTARSLVWPVAGAVADRVRFTPRLEQGVNDKMGLVGPKVRFKIREEPISQTPDTLSSGL